MNSIYNLYTKHVYTCCVVYGYVGLYTVCVAYGYAALHPIVCIAHVCTISGKFMTHSA